MLDINRIRNHPEEMAAKLLKKGCVVDFSDFLNTDKERRETIGSVESLKAKRNKVSAEIPQMKKEGQDVAPVFAEMKDLAEEIRVLDEKLGELDRRQNDFLSGLPNVPADDVVAGGKENNEVISIVGDKPDFSFAPKHHVDLVESLGMIDYTRGAKLSGNGFWVYRGDGALMEWALLSYFIETHLKDGYEFILPPHMLGAACGYTAGQFPKFKDEVYQILDREVPEGFTHFMLPTAETALVNLHRDEILSEADLPCKYFAYTPCYRKEAGSYRAEERGMIRGHQFNKIEMFQYTRPEDSEQALQELVAKAAALVGGLGLHYRVSKLAAADCSASMMKTYDIEIWIPSMNDYKEVSSASNAGDFQARRGNMKFRRADGKSTEFMHTLNASGLATSRILPAIVEQYQQADGSVIIPEVLRKWMGGRDRIVPRP
ncbi:MAG: serine--tRNA ligase [Oscillospiraceae bacterium]|nr:serine--tRNA ligase [Oscillospiraceae bacterium]